MVDLRWPTCISLAILGDEKSTTTRFRAPTGGGRTPFKKYSNLLLNSWKLYAGGETKLKVRYSWGLSLMLTAQNLHLTMIKWLYCTLSRRALSSAWMRSGLSQMLTKPGPATSSFSMMSWLATGISATIFKATSRGANLIPLAWMWVYSYCRW